MKSLIFALAVVFATVFALDVPAAEARGRSYRSHHSSYRVKTVHVKSYHKKNGTFVRSHYRASPRR